MKFDHFALILNYFTAHMKPQHHLVVSKYKIFWLQTQSTMTSTIFQSSSHKDHSLDAVTADQWWRQCKPQQSDPIGKRRYSQVTKKIHGASFDPC